jgi:hypothetical protein
MDDARELPVSAIHRRTFHRLSYAVLLATFSIGALATLTAPASAQNLFEALFGGLMRQQAPARGPAYANPYTDQGSGDRRRPSRRERAAERAKVASAGDSGPSPLAKLFPFGDSSGAGEQSAPRDGGTRERRRASRSRNSDPGERTKITVYPTSSSSYTSPGSYTSGSVSYCVRTCDGRYFPLQRSGDPAQICASFCPASETKVFYGSHIDTARADNGARYATLGNAFVFREKIIAGCTCNGRDPFGLAQIDPEKDETLQVGDIVAKAGGLMAFRGTDRKATAQYTPIRNYSALSPAARKQLSSVKVDIGQDASQASAQATSDEAAKARDATARAQAAQPQPTPTQGAQPAKK